jgi:hypothetical protein
MQHRLKCSHPQHGVVFALGNIIINKRVVTLGAWGRLFSHANYRSLGFSQTVRFLNEENGSLF